MIRDRGDDRANVSAVRLWTPDGLNRECGSARMCIMCVGRCDEKESEKSVPVPEPVGLIERQQIAEVAGLRVVVPMLGPEGPL